METTNLRRFYFKDMTYPSALKKWLARAALGLLALLVLGLILALVPKVQNGLWALGGGSARLEPKAENPSVAKAAKISTEVARRIADHDSLPERSLLGIGLLGEGMDSNALAMESLMQTLAIELSSSKALGTLRALVETRERIKEQSNLARSSDPQVAAAAARRIETLEKEKTELIAHLRTALNAEGFELTAEQVEALAASPNGEDLASLITSFQAVRMVALEMEDRLRAAPGAEHAKTYFGSYCVLLMVMEKIQQNAMRNIRDIYIPKAESLDAEAQHVIDDARQSLAGTPGRSAPLDPAERQSLQFNIATNEESRLRAQRLRAKLEKNLAILQEANARLKSAISVARNSHRTMLVRMEIDRLDLNSTREFEEIQKLILPPMAALNFADPDRPEVTPRKSTVLD
jgi:hypothetical protein